MTNAVKTRLAKAEIDDAIIPGGCTKYIQAPDVVWNKPFKARIQEFYDEWLANAKHEFTAAGNMKPVPRRQIVQWVVKAWEEFSSDMITSSTKSCGLGLPVDGSEDHLISCFKEGKKTESGSKLFSNQTRIIYDSSSEENPFLITEDDIMDATPLENLIDEDDVDFDVDIGIWKNILFLFNHKCLFSFTSFTKSRYHYTKTIIL